MADIKISDLYTDNPVTSLDGTEISEIVDSAGDSGGILESVRKAYILAEQPKMYAAQAVAVLTGAPTATSQGNTTGATFTWARTGTGTYTITANSAVFTSNKTNIQINGFGDAIPKFVTYAHTSTTVITLYVLKMEDLSLDDSFSLDILVTIFP